MKVLILTGKFNMGHWSVAQSLKQELLAAYPQAGVEVEDFVSYAVPGMDNAVYKLFELFVTHAGGLYNVCYRLTEKGTGELLPVHALLFLRGMEELLAEREPDVVIATHPVCAQLVSRCKERGSYGGVLLTCVTDVTDHSEWLCRNCDGYLVGAEAVRDAFVERGVDPGHIAVTGIPVRREFKEPRPSRQTGEKRLLIMGGGLGLMPKSDDFYRAVNDLTNVKTTLITGGNRKLFDRLAGKYPNIQVLGFTPEVYVYMKESDLVLSKPGGATTFEAIFSATPMLAWEPFWEQERRNAAFLVREGMGRIAGKKASQCLAALQELLGDPAALTAMSERMKALRGRLAERGLEELMTKLAGECVHA